MNQNIWNFITDKKIKNGLLLINSPTGFGKTFLATKNIYKYINEIGDDKKIIFVTTLLKNLPVADLEALYTKNKQKKKFLRDAIVLKSNYDYVMDNLTEELANEIPATFKTKRFRKLMEKLSILRKKPSEISLSNETINSYKEEVRNQLEPDFRGEIKSHLGKLKNSAEEKLELIKTDNKYKWIGKIYEAVFSSEKRIFFLSMDKLLVKNTVLIEPSYSFLNDDFIKDSIVFIDEFDATKSIIIKHLIKDAVSNQTNMLNLFKSIYNGIINIQFPYHLTQSYKKRENQNLYSIEKLKTEGNEIIKKFYLNYVFKRREVASPQLEIKRNFLFNDSSFYTILANNKKYIRMTNNEEYSENQIFFEDKDTYKKNKGKDDIQIFSLLRSISNYIYTFQQLIISWGNAYMEAVNSKRDSKEDKFLLPYAIESLYSHFSLSEEQIKFMKKDLTPYLHKFKHHKPSIPVLNFYSSGFKFFEFVDSDRHETQTKFNYIQINNTPENILLNLSKDAKVIAMSATALIDTAIGNYDLTFLQENLQDNFVLLNEDALKDIKAVIKKRENTYKKNKIKTDFQVVDINKKELTAKERLEEFITDNDIVEKYSGKLTALGVEEYRITIYCNIFKVIFEFIKNTNLKSFLCLNTNLPTTANENLKLDIFMDFAEDISNYLHKENSDISTVSHSNPYQIEITVLNSFDFDSKKNTILSKLEKGKRIFVFSSYKTIGAGQNLQYSIPQNIKTISIEKLSKRDPRSSTKDFDGLYLGAITNIVPNIWDENLDIEDLFRYFFTVEYLYQCGNISFIELKNCIRAGFELQNDKRPQMKSLKTHLAVKRTVTKDVIQAIGRICRSVNKNKDLALYTTIEVLELCDPKCIDNSLLLPETKGFINAVKKHVVEYSELAEEINQNKIDKVSKEARDSIFTMLNSSWNEETVRKWKLLRICVLKYPTYSDSLLETFAEDEDIKSILTKFYIKDIDGNAAYHYYQKNDFSAVNIFFKKAYDIHENIKVENEKDLTRLSEVNEKNSRLKTILKYPGLKEYFIVHGYAISFIPGTHILTPVLYNNIYKGALGEVAGKFILEKELNITLEDITDFTKYEFFDFKYGDIYFDFKHWTQNFTVDRDIIIEKIYDKAKSIGAKKVLIINILSENQLENNNFNPHITNDEKIIQIPHLLDKNGIIDKEIVKTIQGVLLSD